MVKTNITFSQNVKGRLYNFALHTSLHGLNRIVASKSVIGKLFWCILFLICAFCSGRQIYVLILQFTSNQVNTKIAIEYDDIYFPEVTFCNLNPLSHEKLLDTVDGRAFLQRLYTGDIYDKHLSSFWQTKDHPEEFTEGCVLASVDLVFLLDASGSILDMEDWFKVLEFCISLIGKSDIESGSVQVSVVTFSTDVIIHFRLNEYTNKDDMIRAVASISPQGGFTDMGTALEVTRTQIFSGDNGDRVDAKKIAILVTDGVPTMNFEKTLSEALAVKASGISMYVVGIGMTEESNGWMSEIASQPMEEYVFLIENYDKLKVLERKIFASLCPDFNALLNLQMEFRQDLMLYAYDMNLQNSTADLNNFLLACSFNGKTCLKRSIVPVYDDFYGKCYKFPSEPLPVKDAGYAKGLQMIFNVSQSDYLPYVSDEAGVRLMIHPPGAAQSLERNGISVATGFRTSISLRQKLNKLVPKKSNCDETGEFLSKEVCVDHCVEDQVEVRCNCTVPGKFRHNSPHPLCLSDNGKQCLLAAERNCSRYKCKNPCRETFYDQVLTMSTWPAEKFIYSTKFKNVLGEDNAQISKQKNNLLIVNIFFYDLAIEVTEEEYSITMENLMSNIGGSLGLWIGMSVITIGEFLEFFIVLLKSGARNRSTNKKDETDIGDDMDHAL